MACVDVTPVFDLAATAALIASFGGGDAHSGVGPVHAEVGTGAQVTISVWRYDLACDTDLVSATASSDITYGAPASWDLTQDGVSLLVGSSVSPPAIWGALTPATGHERLPAGSGILASGYDSFPLVPTLTGTWSGGTLPVLSLYVGVVADVSWTVDPAASVDVTPPTLCLEYTVGSPCATPVPIPQNDTATTTTGTTINIDAMNNDDNTACAPGCVRVREAATFIDPSSTATGITASVDITGAVSFSASGAGTAILNIESGCSPSCDPLGADVATWVPQTLTVTVTPAVTPGPCVEIVPVFDPAKTAALAATLGSEQGTATEVNATSGVGTEWAVGVYTVTIPVGCENDIESITAQSTINASGGVNALNDGALLAVTDDYSTLTPWGTVAPTAGTESVLLAGFLWTGFGGQGGPTPIGNLLEGAWSAGPLPKTEFDLVVIADDSSSDTPDGEYVIAEAPKVCVTYVEGSPCAPEPLPCVEVPLIFNAAATAALAAATGSTAGTGGDTTCAPATMGGVEGVLNVFDVDLGACSLSDVTSITVASNYVKSGVDHDPTFDGGLVAVGDSVGPTPLGSPTAVSGDTVVAPSMGVPGGVTRDFTNLGGTLAASGDPLGATWAVPPGTTVLQVFALAVANVGDAVSTVTLPTVCVEFAPGSPCAPAPLPCVEIPVTFDQAATDAIAAAFGADPSTDPTGPLATAGVGSSNAMWVGLVEIPPGCDTEVVSVEIASTVDVSAGMDSGTDGAGITVAETPATPAPWGTVTATDGDVSVIAPQMLSTGYVDIGGTAWPALPATIPLAGTYSGGPLPASTLAVVAYADALSAESVPGSTIKVNVPQTVCVTFATENCPPAADPIPVDDTASTTTGTTITVNAAANDNNTPCDPLPGCAVYNTTVVVEPGSTAGGITASVDSAGVATVNATSAGTAIVTIESGCSPSCDPLGADVTVWVPQTLTVTFVDQPGPCVAVPVVFDQALTDQTAIDFAGAFGVPFESGTADGVTSTGGGAQQVAVFRIPVGAACQSAVTNVRAAADASATEGALLDTDGVNMVVASQVFPPTAAGPVTPLTGDADRFIPGGLSAGYVQDPSNATIPSTLDGTWTATTAPSADLFLVLVSEAEASGPSETISLAAPATVCVTFSDPDCPDLPPIPADDIAAGVGCSTVSGQAWANDDNSPCGTKCPVYRLVTVAGTAPDAAGTVDPGGNWTASASDAGTVILTIESGCSPSCDPTGADVTTWASQTVTVTFAAAPRPVPVDDTATGTVGQVTVGTAAANDNTAPCAPSCAVYRLVTVGGTAAGATGTVAPSGAYTAQASGPGTVILTIEAGCSPTCDLTGADVCHWTSQTVTVTFTEPAGPCETVNAIYDPAASAFFAGFFTGFFAGTAGGPGGPTGQGSQGPTISVYQVDAPSVCVATIASVQVQSTVTASPGFDPTNDTLTVAVFSDLSTFTIWGTPTAISGQANITFPGAVSSGYTSGGGTLVPLIDATWSGGPATSPIYVVVVADASESAPGESIAGSAPILCVEFGDPDCPPASNPKPADVVKLCVAAAPQAGCATFGGTPSPTLFVAVSGPDGNVIPANSTTYPSNSVGGSDGSGYIRSYYTTTSGLVVTPDAGSWTPGSCGADAMQLPAGAVSIANGIYAVPLGPDGSTWFPPSGLRSVTVVARHAATNDTATASGTPGRIEIYTASTVFMLLDGETFTWSVDDPDSLTTISEVRCEADAAAAIVWVAG